MKDFLSSLHERTAEFGNHYRKYTQIVSRYLDQLIQKLEAAKRRDLVHIINPSHDFEAEINIVGIVAETPEEKLNFLGTFFALQFLLFNRQTIDMLRMEIIAGNTPKLAIYKRFMRNAGNTFRVLTANYIKELIDIFVTDKERTEFVILGVGTKSDQDDIDVGIIDDGRENRERFNRAISIIAHEMLKYATSFHFHLSEHIGTQHYSASIDEYKHVLEQEIRDFVIINEMLSAAVIIGSEELFRQYKKEITNRYFYQPGGDNTFHEGYLRGILGEISALIARPISTTHINFKEDGLRAIKSIISAHKTIFNIERVNAWDIIEDLKARNSRRTLEYEGLERALTFFEIFRHLYQLFVTQDEEVVFDDVSLKNIHKVARVMGYVDIGKNRAEDHLFVHYYEHLQNTRGIIQILVADSKLHLQQNSVFVSIFDSKHQGNIALDFIERFRFFRGTSFWDDILDNFKNGEILKRFVDDINKLSPDERKNIIHKYIDWISYDFKSLIKFLITLSRDKSKRSVFKDLNERLFRIIDRIPGLVRNIAYVFFRYPHLINSYLALNEEPKLRAYLEIFEGGVYEEEIAGIIENLKGLIKIHLDASQFFKRYFLQSLDRYPECIEFLKKSYRLKEFAESIYSDVSSMRTFEEKKRKLGDYYDFEMMRVGIDSLRGTSIQTTNTEFIEFSDRYMNMLVDLCRQEVDAGYAKRIITDDVLAIFATGGHAREQAYEDDYDIIVLLNSSDPEVLVYCNKIISKMNAEIIKRGTIPHHRFGEYFGRFVIRLDEVERLLSEERPDIFIEQSQILGARLIIGSHRFEKEFLDRVMKRQIFDRKRTYIEQTINDMYSRHLTEAPDNNIKEGIGGLRDIEMVMLIIKAHFNIKDPVTTRLFEQVANIQPDLKSGLQTLANGFSFLKNLRDIYRLTAGATDTIVPEALDTAARITGFGNSQELYQQYRMVGKEVASAIDVLITQLGYGPKYAG